MGWKEAFPLVRHEQHLPRFQDIFQPINSQQGSALLREEIFAVFNFAVEDIFYPKYRLIGSWNTNFRDKIFKRKIFLCFAEFNFDSNKASVACKII